MSRKRPPKSQQVDEAVPSEEILAEGSGPNEVVDANPQTLVAAAQELVDKRKERKDRKARRKKDAEGDEAVAAAGGDADADAADAVGEEAGARDAAGADADDAADADAALEAVAAVDGRAMSIDAEGASERELVAGASDDSDDSGDADDADEAAFDASGSNVAPETSEEQLEEMLASAEGQAIAAVEDAVMRAEAEAELGDAELEGDELVAADDPNAALPTSAASMDAAQLKHLVEALVFAADKPMTLQRLRQLTRVAEVKRLEDALAEITVDYANRGIALQVVSGGYQFRTNTTYSTWVQQLIAGRPVRLSRAQLETLAIVAYRQPITRPEIDEIRGVDSSATLRLLLDRSLIRSLGKKEDVGRPMLYGTTREFLDFFSLNDLRELPTLREYSELTAESRKVMSDELGIDEASPLGEYGADGTDGFIDADSVESSGAAEAEPELDSTEQLARWAREPDASPRDRTAEILEAAVDPDDSAAESDAATADSDDASASDAMDADASGDESDALDAQGPTASAAGHVVRDGIEYDRWGQPLGPIAEDVEAAVAAASDDESLETASADDSSLDESLEAVVTDESAEELDAASASSDELGVVAGASFEERANLDLSGTADAPSAVADLANDELNAVDDASTADDVLARADDAPVDRDASADDAQGDEHGTDEPTHD